MRAFGLTFAGVVSMISSVTFIAAMMSKSSLTGSSRRTASKSSLSSSIIPSKQHVHRPAQIPQRTQQCHARDRTPLVKRLLQNFQLLLADTEHHDGAAVVGIRLDANELNTLCDCIGAYVKR